MMELHPLCVILMLTGLIHRTQTESPKPAVIIKPDTQVFRGEEVTFKCDMQEGTQTYWTYDWFRDDNALLSYYSKQFSISSVTDDDGGKYTCSWRIDFQISKRSDPVTLTVSEKPKPTVRGNPQRAVYTGHTVTLSCNLQSTGWTFLWYENQKWNPWSPETSENNTLQVKVSEEGVINYYCKARRGNYDSEISSPATITVKARPKPTVKVQAADPVFVGESVTLSCEIQTEGSWYYQWFRDHIEISDATGKKMYTITDVYESSKAAYTCSGTQSSDPKYTETSDAVTLKVTAKPKPELISSLKGNVLTGNSVTLTCKLGTLSSGWKFYWDTPTRRTATKTETETLSYTISSVSDRGNYWCRAGRGNPVYYTHYSDALWVNVIESPKPKVTIKPDTQVFMGEKVTFRCDVQNARDTEWTYDWFKYNNRFYPQTHTQELIISAVRNEQITCRGRRRSDSQISKTSDSVTLTVSEKPKAELTSDLKGAALTGTSVTLSCKLNSQSSGWKFYWTKHTHTTETETNTHHYFISSVRVSDGGQYRCRAGRGNPVYYTYYSDAFWVNVTGESPPVSLIINPSRTQHFPTDSLSLSCEDQSDSTGWTVRGHTHSDSSFSCSSVSGATCNIHSLSTSHTGLYWCQSESGERSYAIDITVHDGDVILDSPVYPVTDGHHLTLRCLYRSPNNSISAVNFYKNNFILQSQTTGELTISSVSKSDEGFYHCKHPERGESPQSWVSVRVLSHGKSPTSVLKHISSAVTASVYVLLTIVLAFKCYRARTAPDKDNKPYRVIEAETSA